jgi:hypothetical protein
MVCVSSKFVTGHCCFLIQENCGCHRPLLLPDAGNLGLQEFPWKMIFSWLLVISERTILDLDNFDPHDLFSLTGNT